MAARESQHFVLIHGLTSGAWCWFKIKCQLEALGCHVTCLDLKSCGSDPTDPTTIHTFDHYNQPLHDFMASLPQDQKVILVGHSAGGISVTRALHSFPNKIHMVIYICATMLKLGFHSKEDYKIGIPEFKEEVCKNEESEGSISTRFKKIFVPEFIPPIGSPEDFELITKLSRPGPLRAIVSSKITEDETSRESNNIPRVYIKTLKDRVLKPDQQQAMIERWEPYQVYSVETDHDIIFAHPIVLSDLLIRAVSSSLAFYKD